MQRLIIVLFILMTASSIAFALEPLPDKELSQITGQGGFAGAGIIENIPDSVFEKTDLTRGELTAQWDTMTFDEKKATISDLRSNMSSEEQSTLRDTMRAQFQSLSPEKQEQIRENISQRFGFGNHSNFSRG